MSHDDTKDLSFNQLYAGRSRVRRDVNTLKTQVAYGHQTSVANSGTGLTKYFLAPRLGGGLHTAALEIEFGSGKVMPCGPLAGTLSMTDATNLNNAECSIPIWRGPGDSAGRVIRGKSTQDLTPDNNVYTIVGATMQLLTLFDGSASMSQVGLSLGVANAGKLALIDGQDGSNPIVTFTGGTGTLYTLWPQASNAAAEAGNALQYGIYPSWIHNQASATDSNNTGIELGTGNPSTDNDGTAQANFPGVHLNVKCSGGSSKVKDITAGKVLVQLLYTCDPL